MADRYALMSCGASMGRNYGPIVISGKPMNPNSLAGKTVAIPGEMTTAWLALQLF
jgi:1,4-dihydroxy-6-naphthoate synthase